MSDANPLAGLNAAELAALAKAQAAGVNVVNKDGSTTNVSETTPKAPAAPAAPPASASGDVQPAGSTPPAAPAAPAEGAKPTRPDNVPEKFWDAEKGVVNTEALLKSYGELERARSKPAESTETKPATMTPPAEKPAEGTPPPAAKTPEQIAAETEAARGAAVQAATADLAQADKISDATYAKLAAVGYSRAVVDEFVAGQRAQATLVTQGIHAAAGGKETYDSMVAWGKANYTAAEQSAFDAAIRSGNTGQATMAVNGLKARFTADLGKTGTRVDANSQGGAAAGNAFRSQQEYIAATSDAKYAKDANYRAEVSRRVEASLRAGIDIGIRIQR